MRSAAVIDFMALFCLAGCGAVRAASVPPESGYDLSSLGHNVKINRVFRAGDGHFVLQFGYRDHGVFKTDFYDTQKHAPLFPSQAFALARDNALERKLTAGLVPQQSDRIGSNGGGRMCGDMPYVTNFSIGTQLYVFLTKNPHPLLTKFGPDCGTSSLTLRYSDRILKVFGRDDKGFWAQPGETPYMIWFDSNGHSPFLRHRSDIVLVPYENLDEILSEHEDGDLPNQKQIKQAEILISRYAARQMKDAAQ